MHPDQTGSVLGTEAAHLPYHVVAVPDLQPPSGKGSRERGRRIRCLAQDFQGIFLPSPFSDCFPSDRVVSEDTGDGGGGPISSPIEQSPPPLRPPLCLLPVPRRAMVTGVRAPTTRRWGEGGILHVLRKSWVHSEPAIRGSCRHTPTYMLKWK